MGFAAEFRGAKLCIKVAIAMLICVVGIFLNTCSKSKIIYGLQHKIKTEK